MGSWWWVPSFLFKGREIMLTVLFVWLIGGYFLQRHPWMQIYANRQVDMAGWVASALDTLSRRNKSSASSSSTNLTARDPHQDYDMDEEYARNLTMKPGQGTVLVPGEAFGMDGGGVGEVTKMIPVLRLD